jgi:hypothetical protein
MDTPPRTIKILLADDHILMRTTLAAWLVSQGDFVIVGEAPDAATAIDLALRQKPEIVLFDIDMPGLLAFDAARTIQARVDGCKVVFLSAFSHDSYIQQALASGASGYLTKSQPPQTIAESLRVVASGGVVFAPEIEARLVIDTDGVRLGDSASSRVGALTPRELEVLRYLANGMSKKEVAGIMHLSVKTVDNHTTSLMHKLDIHDRVELARFAIREGLTKP